MDAEFFKQTFHLRHDAGAPIYEQLISYFKLMISTGELKEGEQVVTENDICEALGISRTTVRQAMDKLVAAGLLVRYRGKGTFIGNAKMRRSMNYLYNFTENMHELGVTPSSKVLLAAVEEADDLVRKKLEFPFDQAKVFHLRRVRCGDGEPILFEDTFIPYYLTEGIEEYDFAQNSLYDILTNRYNLNLYHAKETIEAVVLGKTEAMQLGTRAGSAGYRIMRTSNLLSGYPFEFTRSITRAERCVFEYDLFRSEKENRMQFARRVSF